MLSPSSLPRLIFTHRFSTSSLAVVWRGREWEPWSVHLTLLLLLLRPQVEESHTLLIPKEAVQHYHLQSEPFPWATALHKLLWCGSPLGSQVLPVNLFQCELISPQGHKSHPEPVPAWAFHRHPPAPVWVSSKGCRWISTSLWINTGCRGTAASP